MISQDKGRKIYYELVHHDDGLDHYGGESVAMFGKPGSGKSTLLQHLCQATRYLPKGSKIGYTRQYRQGRADISRTKPETIIYRGREFDIWNSLIPANWNNSFPNYTFKPKQVCLFTHKDDDLSFDYFDDVIRRKKEIENLPHIIEYKDAEDCIKMIKEGAINVVYEPQSYSLPDYMVTLLEQKKFEKMELVEERELNPLKTKKQSEKPKKKPKGSVVYPPMFWYELADRLPRQRGGSFFTIILDEVHHIAPGRPEGDLWKLIDIFADSLVDFRKNNISFYLATHDPIFVDWRILDRVVKFIWMPGCLISKRHSRIYRDVITKIDVGSALIESKLLEYGEIAFPRIINQPPLVRVSGMRGIKG